MKIIVATDGSNTSRAAIEALVGTRWSPGTEIKLMNAIRPTDIGMPLLTFGASQSGEPHDLVKQREKMLESLAAEVHEKLPHCKVTIELASGDAKACVVDAAKEWPADMVLLGSRGHKGLELILLGSVSQGIVMSSPCPVVIVKSGPGASHGGFRKVLLTIDSSPYARAALDWVLRLQWCEDTVFKLITAIPPHPSKLFDAASVGEGAGSLAAYHDQLRATAANELQLFADELEKAFGPDKVSIEVGAGDPREVILEIADAFPADLIVMGSHGTTGLTRLLMGSVSQTIAVQSPHSVAVIRGKLPRSKDPNARTGAFKRSDLEDLKKQHHPT
jgi:nucleotide-binding universal stress UspA family protein